MGDKASEVRRWLNAMPFRDNPKRVVGSGAQQVSSLGEWVAKGRDIANVEEELLRMLQKEQHAVARSWAAQALGFVGRESCINALIEALASGVPLVQMEAAAALGRLGRVEAVEPLCNALKSRDSNVRASACTALGMIRSERALVCLQEAFQDQDPLVQAAARAAIRLRDA